MQTFPWTPAHSLTSETISLLVREQFPSLTPARVSALYEGWDNEALEINEEWMFRFPKRTDGELPLEREQAFLSRLRYVLPVPVPAYQLIGRPGPSLPFVFTGYPRLDGTPAIDWEERIRAILRNSGPPRLLHGDFSASTSCCRRTIGRSSV